MTNGLVSVDGPETADAAIAPAADPGTRSGRWRKHALAMQAFVTASFCIDAACMALLAFCGAIAYSVPLVYASVYALTSGGFTLLISRVAGGRFKDPFLTMPQMLVASTIQFALMLWVPAIGIPVLTGLFIIVGFAGLRLSLAQAGLASLWLTIGVSIVIGLRGEALSIALDTPAQRFVSGLWISTVLARVIMLGQYGAQLRKALVKRNEALNQAMATAERLASRDGLTGALNRGSILKAIEAERQRMSRTGQGFSVALLDLDHFKRINDSFGHLVGDVVLCRVVTQISSELRATDQFGRYGGEEFLLLLGDSGDLELARQAVERILSSVETHPWPQVALGLAVTTSAGLATCHMGESMTQLLSRADNALYEAKNAGRNRVSLG